MTWMLTQTGATVDLEFVAEDAISILDIAHSLALTNRFTGHTSRPYSVAEHSLLVLSLLQAGVPDASPLVLLAALMHDAHEAYIGDMSSPMKEVLGPYWRIQELRVQATVLRRFDLVDAYAAARDLIRHYDIEALGIERTHLMPASGAPWPVLEGCKCGPFPAMADREGLTWQDWRDLFLSEFHGLQYECFKRGLLAICCAPFTTRLNAWEHA